MNHEFNNSEKHARVLFSDECVVSLRQRAKSIWSRSFP